MDENINFKDYLNDEPNLEQEIEQTIDDVDFSTMQNDDAC